MVVITGLREVSCRGWKPGRWVRQELGAHAEGFRVEAQPLASCPWEGPPPLYQDRPEAVTMSPGFVLAARIENASVGRLDGWGMECRFSL